MTLVAGNWKMNGLIADLKEIDVIASGLPGGDVDAMICLPALILQAGAARTAGSRLMIGAQDCHTAASGAHTGDISAQMIADAGGQAVIVGHSERRANHDEADSIVKEKAEAALDAGLTAIICVGESDAQRDAGNADSVVADQLAGSVPQSWPDKTGPDKIVVAYEPIWAIGTGRTAGTDDIADMHHHIRNLLVSRFDEAGHRVRILYGGSVKPDNAAEILRVANVNGALVGGASLKASDFLAIVRSAVTG